MVKEVSLELKSDPALAEFVSLAEQQNEILRVLTGYGIAVRPNAPLTLLVTVEYPVQTIKTTYNVGESSQQVRGIYVDAQFFVNAAALRNGKFHVVRASIMSSIAGSTFADANGIGKALFGDRTGQSIRDNFVNNLADTFKSIASSTSEPDSWVVNSWSDKQKAAADAAFAKAMAPGAPIDRNPYDGVTGQPRLDTDPYTNYDDCKVDPGWCSSWLRVFERLHWTAPEEPPSLTVWHYYSCVYAFGAPPRYFQLLDRIQVLESNLVYELNGKLVRSRGAIGEQHHETIALENDAGDRSDDRMGLFLSRNVTEFLTDLVLGNGQNDRGTPVGALSSGSAPVSKPATPAKPGSTPAPSPAPPPVDDDPIGPGGFITPPDSAVPAPGASRSAAGAPDRANLLQWVRADMPAYVLASKTGFAAYKNGAPQLSQGYRMWDSLIKPAQAKGRWVVQGSNSTTFSCLLLEQADLSNLRSYYTELNKDIIASLPRDWMSQAAPPFSGDLPNQGYRSSSGAHLEVWIARAESGAGYKIHFQLVSAH